MSKPHGNRIAQLRQVLQLQKLDGFLIPLIDEHASEYIGDYAQRLAFMTGFTGSAGSAIVLRDRAAIFIDGRYELQVKSQVDPALYEHVPTATTDPVDWLAAAVTNGAQIGYDAELHTRPFLDRVRAALKHKGASLSPVEKNPVDAVWPDRPRPSAAPAYPHLLEYAGVTSRDKRRELGAVIASKGAEIAVITALDSIAWLFNIRGSDVLHTPVTLGYALLEADGQAQLFIAQDKVDDALRAHLGNGVALAPYGAFHDALSGLKGKRVLADPDSANAAIFERLASAGIEIIEGADPCALPKARKNPVEIAGTRAAHIRDGAAVTEFLYWIDCHAAKGGVTEMQAAEKLLSFRQARGGLMDTSFDTISGSGPNGAIVHYRVTPESNRELHEGELYLVDSGGQYLDGTTDITRTVPIGEVGEEERTRFTLVLKGHIALATLHFPKGTTGAQVDAIARRPLWDYGLDYDHGTGHGVGSFLAVHEGPQRIAKIPNRIALEPGMILSNEPGYYRNGAYGIRIENLVVVAEEKRPSERPFLHFETITLAPIDYRLIRFDMLDDREKHWIDLYHGRVRETLMPLLSDPCRSWLEAMTTSLEEGSQQ